MAAKKNEQGISFLKFIKTRVNKRRVHQVKFVRWNLGNLGLIRTVRGHASFRITSRISASSFSSSSLISVKIFKHGPYFFPRKGYDSVSTSAPFSFKQSLVKIWKGKVNIQSLGFTDIFLSIFGKN